MNNENDPSASATGSPRLSVPRSASPETLSFAFSVQPALVELRVRVSRSLREARMGLDLTNGKLPPFIFDELCDAICALAELEQTVEQALSEGLGAENILMSDGQSEN